MREECECRTRDVVLMEGELSVDGFALFAACMERHCQLSVMMSVDGKGTERSRMKIATACRRRFWLCLRRRTIRCAREFAL